MEDEKSKLCHTESFRDEILVKRTNATETKTPKVFGDEIFFSVFECVH